tara:strand:- start:437 stop:799 length:363 start_codon:yes stop_codon:yes gene_type:complete
MYNKEILKGIIISLARGLIQLTCEPTYSIGYKVVFSIRLNGDPVFLEAIQRSLAQHNIVANMSKRELRIYRQDSIAKLIELIENEYCPKLETFIEGYAIWNSDLPKARRFDAICKLKGLI